VHVRVSRHGTRGAAIPCSTRKISPAALAVAPPAHEDHPHRCPALSEQSRAELTDGLVQLRAVLAAVELILDSRTAAGPYRDDALNRDALPIPAAVPIRDALPIRATVPIRDDADLPIPDTEVNQACRHALALLTPRESEVLLSIGRGQSNRRAAHVLHISEKTVKNHLSAVFSKLGAVDRTQAVVIGIRGGAIALDAPPTRA
jgi:DNA-binding CsgD family transcriptional regulator